MDDNENIKVYRGNTDFDYVDVNDLKKEISKYMQSDNLNFLLGAGCSSYRKNKSEFGIPIMSGLYDEFKEKYPHFSIGNKKIFQDSVFEKDLNYNLEMLMEKLISLRDVKDYINLDADSINENIYTVKQFINEKIKNINFSDSPVLDIYKEFYLRIVRKNKRNPINVATTNYDLFNEMALDNLGFYYNDGFSGTFERKFNPLTYGYIYANNMNLKNNTWDRVDNYFNLFKIHGSISWSKDDGQIYEKDPKSINNNVMIYPTPLKDRSTLMVPYSDLFRSFENQLSLPNSVLITIGYSFGDDHINRIILNNLSSQDFRLIVLGDIGKSNSILNDLLKNKDPRIIVINSDKKIHYFNNFVNKLMPDPLDDVKEKQLVKKISDNFANIIYNSGDRFEQ